MRGRGEWGNGRKERGNEGKESEGGREVGRDKIMKEEGVKHVRKEGRKRGKRIKKGET